VQLHLNTIHAVVQLRPSLEHLKSGGSKRKNNAAVDAEATVKLEESAEEKSVGPSKKQVIFFYLTYEEYKCMDLIVFIVGTPQAYPCLEFNMYSDIYNQYKSKLVITIKFIKPLSSLPKSSPNC
jgi:hypothetical protein